MEVIEKAFNENQVIVIDGLRSWEEYLYLKNHLHTTRIFIINVYADKKVRYHRAAHRTDRKNQFGEIRDINELVGTNMGPTIAFADFVVKNNFSKEDFTDKLETVYRQIYFS